MFTNENSGVQKMDNCASDSNGECLVTDLVHELSLGLEIPFLLGENIKTMDKTESISPLDCMFYDEPFKEKWEDSYFSFTNNCESTFTVKDEINNDFQSFLEKNNIERNHSTSGLSGSGSGSECSSTEFWTTKAELDTPPVTPPDERKSPDSVFLLPPDELKFMPICSEKSLLEEKKINSDLKSGNKRVKIQPKPASTTLNIYDSQLLDFQPFVCSLVNDDNLSSIKNQESTLESKLFFSPNYGKKKSLLTKKELELLQAKKKQERMIRNRESAYLSRKRKKEHLIYLEKQVQDLQTENKHLKLENSKLRQRLAKYENLELSSGKRPGNVFIDSPRKTTALLALLFTVCLNIGSFSSLINEKKMYKTDNIVTDNIVLNYPSELRHARSLLWADNDLGNLNSTYANLTKTSCPLSVNQTESIRLESELRRWIGDEEHSRKAKFNISKVSQYFNSGEKSSLHKNVSKRKQRAQKSNFQRKNLEMDMYQMNVLNFNSFFEAIHRRDDTFYLVSFSSDHLLLPALSHNQTSRPKMSLMLPAYFSNVTGADQVEMMQIDCEVTNTQLLSVNENDIPSHIRPYSNSTSRTKGKTKVEARKFEEYFMSDLPVTLVPAEKINFKTGKNNLKFSKSSGNHSDLFSLTSKNFSKSSDFDVLNFQQPPLNFTLSNNAYKNKNAQYLQFKRNVFPNQTYKQDQNAVDFVSSYGKNLLRLLMVGPAVSNSKSMKFNHEKSFYKSFPNSTRTLFN